MSLGHDAAGVERGAAVRDRVAAGPERIIGGCDDRGNAGLVGQVGGEGGEGIEGADIVVVGVVGAA